MSVQKKKIKKKEEPKSTILQRLAQASMQDLIIQSAVNTVVPGAGIALGLFVNGRQM